MKLGKLVRGAQVERRKAKARKTASLVTHRAFVPMLALWGALLGGLSVMVMPASKVIRATGGAMLGSWSWVVQPVAACLAAALLGTVLYVIAAVLADRARPRKAPRPVVGEDDPSVQPIDPLRDLGTDGLDAPIETMPFATHAWSDAALDGYEDDGAYDDHDEYELDGVYEDDGVEASMPWPASDPHEPEAPAPRELDLAEFGEWPGRNAVWVEDPVPAPQPDADFASVPNSDPVAAPVVALPRAVASPPPAPGQAALARLRAMPTSELSLVEMVERFAGALHEHRAVPGRAPGADVAAREAALAEALKALAALSGEVSPDPRGAEHHAPLRAALAQLQAGRGAA